MKGLATVIIVGLIAAGMTWSAAGCESKSEPVPVPPPEPDTIRVIDPADVDVSKIYIPEELKSNDFYKSSSVWYYGRSRQSEHFIVFWGAGYRDNDPNAPEVPETYRVDIDDLLARAEDFYEMNVTKLKFAEEGSGRSNLDKYKMMIFVFYQQEWLATGAGYDDVIGALWVSPSTCRPVGSVIAHEIGHSFQYQVFCDLGGSSGFRYGFGGNGGNGFWEQTAQWQALQSYPQEAFSSYHFAEYVQNYNRHVCHEAYRYASYFMHYYWADKHGVEMIGKLWRGAQQPEDPMQAYMRLTGITVGQFNEKVYEAATRFVTWDIDALRERGGDYIGAHTFNSTRLDDGSHMVAYDRCPGTTGYNVIRLNVPPAGTEVSTKFTGMPNAEGFNPVNELYAGWRYGYVALLDDGTRVYGDMNKGTSSTVTFTVPAQCSKLWFVVTGAPNVYTPHAWDDDETNDAQWPYKVRFTNTSLYGDVVFDGTETPEDVTITYDVSFSPSATDYTGTAVEMSDDEIASVAKAFVLQPGEIAAALGSGIVFYAVEPGDVLDATTTANGFGHWYDAEGKVIAWGAGAMVFSEYDNTKWTFTLGQYPGRCSAGDQFTVKQAFVYRYGGDQEVRATFVFNISIM